MVKSGLIFGAVMLVLALGVSLISPFCSPCVAIFIGLAAGYVACVFDKPLASGDGLKKGAIAGAIAGGLGLIGQVIAAVINSQLVSAEQINQINEMLGNSGSAMDQATIQAIQLGSGFCIGLFNVLIIAGLGLAGAAIWNATQGKKQVPPPMYTPMQ